MVVERHAVHEGEVIFHPGKFLGWNYRADEPTHDWLCVRLPWWSFRPWSEVWRLTDTLPGFCWLVILWATDSSGQHEFIKFKERRFGR